jgi:hypothetical protein
MGHICSLLPSPSISSPSASYSFFRGGLLFWSSSILSSVVRSMWASDNICGEPNRWASPYEEKCLYLGCKDYAKRNQESMRYPILDPVIPVFYPVSRLLDFSPQSIKQGPEVEANIHWAVASSFILLKVNWQCKIIMNLCSLYLSFALLFIHIFITSVLPKCSQPFQGSHYLKWLV